MMYFIWVIGALAVAGAGWALRPRAPRFGRVLMVVGGLACLAAIGWQVRTTLFPPTVKLPPRAHTAVGYVLASQIQRDIAGRSGSVVLLLAGSLDASTAEAYAGSFRAPLLRGHPEWTVEVVRVDIPQKEAQAGMIPAVTFKQVTEQHPKALAFVSCAGAPAGLESLYPGGQGQPVIHVFDPAGTTNWVRALLERQIRSVIVPKPNMNPAAADAIAGMPGEIFAQLYYLATPENALQIAAKLATPGDAPHP